MAPTTCGPAHQYLGCAGCSAAVGVLAGGGALPYAAIVAMMVIAVNLLLRPLVQRINRQPLTSAELPSGYVVNVICKGDREAHVRALLLQGRIEAVTE